MNKSQTLRARTNKILAKTTIYNERPSHPPYNAELRAVK